MFGPDSKTNTIYLGSGPLMVVNGQTNKVTASDPSAGLGYGGGGRRGYLSCQRVAPYLKPADRPPAA